MIDDDWFNETSATKFWRRKAEWWRRAWLLGLIFSAAVWLLIGWLVFG